ncbi:MAG: hypothetical protein GY795_12745 [Desulfobacterales bacterium]|nr:hypothetical protein [Desulfobacterales bacterium]
MDKISPADVDRALNRLIIEGTEGEIGQEWKARLAKVTRIWEKFKEEDEFQIYEDMIEDKINMAERQLEVFELFTMAEKWEQQ